MNDQELRLECVRIAGGAARARDLYNFVTEGTAPARRFHGVDFGKQPHPDKAVQARVEGYDKQGPAQAGTQWLDW